MGMSLGIRQKLLIAFAFTSLLITGIAFVAMLFSFRAGFLQYINDYRYQSLEQLQQVLSEKVQTQRDWLYLIRHQRQWHQLVREMLQNHAQAGFVVPARHRHKVYKDHQRLPASSALTSEDSVSFFRSQLQKRRPPAPPFLLLASDKKIIYGAANINVEESMWLLPVMLDDQVIGYVGMDKLTHFTSDAEHVFVADQTRYFIWIAVAAGVMALIVAFILARWMVVPIQRLDKAMSALMQRDYDANVQYQSSDEIGRLVSSFNQLAKALGEYDHTQQQWIADISHELRTPLATLRGELEAMQEGVRTYSPQRLDSLHEEVLRLQRIVDDLHQLSLSDAGAMRYSFHSLSLTTIIQQVLERSSLRLQEKKLQYDMAISGDETSVYGDADRLAQLFNNLLQNSVRYTDNNGRLNVSVRFQQDKTVTVTWEDSEPGVLSTSLEKLFDRLYREEKSRNRDKGGSGLGLSICRSIVNAHRGDITAKASSLGGVAITIVLPLMHEQ